MTIKPPEIVARELVYPRRDVWILLAIAFVYRLATCWINEAEYTDGIIQIRQFSEPIGIWPPLYSALVYPLKFLIGFEWGGILVSVLASSLAIVPLYRMARRAFGTRAALYAGIFYLCAPVAARWGIRAMTEATFCLFLWWGIERLCSASDERHERTARWALFWGAMAVAAAALARYQGVLLIPAVFICAWELKKRFGRWPLRPLLGLLPLGLLAVWVWWVELGGGSFIHAIQFGERAFDAKMPSHQVLALNGEAFVANFPYFMTYPAMAFAIFGMFWMRQRRGPFFGWLAFWHFAMTLVLQSYFSSFQERYFLPVMVYFWVLAGAGLYAIEERWHRHGAHLRRYSFPYLMIGSFAFGAAMSFFVLWGQREAFGDIARASRLAAKVAGKAPVYTNEMYRAEPLIAATKVRHYAGRPVDFLSMDYLDMGKVAAYLDGGELRAPVSEMAPGSVVVLSDTYGGRAQYAYLVQFYEMRLVEPPVGFSNPETARLMPILPDIMSRPGVAQNPLAWTFRYEWQDFSTSVYRVEGKRGTW